MQAVENKKIFAPTPKGAQGYSSCFVSSPDGKWFSYVVKNVVVLRNMEDPSQSQIFSKHGAETTAVTFHPKGELIASSDVSGLVKIWKFSSKMVEKEYRGLITGKIYGLEFSQDGDKLLVYGASKGIFAKIINWETGDDLGELKGAHGELYAGCISKQNTIMVGGIENVVNFFAGYPYEQKCILKEHTQGKYITTIRSTPDGTKMISSGFDKKIIIYDPAEGKVLDSFDASKIQNGHKMAIMASAFLDNERLITVSIDRTLKIWNIKEKTLLMTLIVKDEKKLDTSYILCGVVTNGKKIYACSLGGTIYEWNVDTIADNKLPDASYLGHQETVNYCTYIKSTKQIVSGDIGGKVLIWNEDSQAQLVIKKESAVSKVYISPDETLIYFLQMDGSVFACTKDKFEEKVKVPTIGGGARGLVFSKKNNDIFYVMTSSNIASVEKGVVKKKHAYKFSVTCFDVNEELGEVYVGDNSGTLHILDMNFEEKSKKNYSQGEITAIKLSPDSKAFVMTDSKGYIKVFDAGTKELKYSEMRPHTSKIFDLDISEDSQYFITGSLDYNVIINEVGQKKKIQKFDNLNGNYIICVKFTGNNKDFICCGPNCAVEYISFQ